jgi:hypothetical protein
VVADVTARTFTISEGPAEAGLEPAWKSFKYILALMPAVEPTVTVVAL